MEREKKNTRTLVMGMATIGILLVHSLAIVQLPMLVQKVFEFGGVGVYVFVFLSAIGLYCSLKNHDREYSKKVYYIRRIERVFLPYLLISFFWYGFIDIIEKQSLWLFLYDMSTLSFWIEHKGAWYVAMLVPVYLIFPWFFDWVENHKYKRIKVLGGDVSSIHNFLYNFYSFARYV